MRPIAIRVTCSLWTVALTLSATLLGAEGIVLPDLELKLGDPVEGDSIAAAAGDDSAQAVYLGGETWGALEQDKPDAFVTRHDLDGAIRWWRQFGSDGQDFTEGITVTGSGTVAVVGWTTGTLPGQVSLGGKDGWLRLYDADGNELWTRQFGSEESDEAAAVAATSDGLVVAGHTQGSLPGHVNLGGRDAAVWKYDFDGELLWVLQFGSESYDELRGVDVSGDVVYLGGHTTGDVARPAGSAAREGFAEDLLVRRIENDGTEVWTVQFGEPGATSEAEGLAADQDGLSIVGYQGLFGLEAIVYRLDPEGSVLWRDRFDSNPSEDAWASGVSTSPLGVFVSGQVEGLLPGQMGAGGRDAFVRRYDRQGNLIWTVQLGTAEGDFAEATTIVGSHLFAAGYAGSDGYLVRFTEDTDTDGIYDRVDLLPDIASSEFSDPEDTAGTVVDPGGQLLHVMDAVAAGAGIYMAADSAGSGAPASLLVCEEATQLTLDAGDAGTVTCGSVLLAAASGSVGARLFGMDGTTADVEVAAGEGLGFSPEITGFLAAPTNESPLSIVIAGDELILEPGDKTRFLEVDVIPAGQPCIDPDSEDPLVLELYSTPLLDATEIESVTVRIEETRPILCAVGGCLVSFEDRNDDGLVDQALQVDGLPGLPPGDHQLTVTGRHAGGFQVWATSAECVL